MIIKWWSACKPDYEMDTNDILVGKCLTFKRIWVLVCLKCSECGGRNSLRWILILGERCFPLGPYRMDNGDTIPRLDFKWPVSLRW